MSTEQPDTHLISDHDNIGEPLNWCGAESFNGTESIAETTCQLCLKAAAIYGQGASEQLKRLRGTNGPTDTESDQRTEPSAA